MIPANELALAYELRQEGCQWKLIGIGLGRNSEQIRFAVLYKTKRGLGKS